MSSITQTINSYIGGISQQPDQKKLPGQVTEAVNVLPDVTLGLQKRPGAELVASLSDGTLNSYTTGRWFHYYRDENEQYIGQVIRRSGHADDGKIRMWKCSDGSEKIVSYYAVDWKTDTVYTVGTYVIANAKVYKCVTTGTSADSGTGPSSTGSVIQDGGAQWAYQQTSAEVQDPLINYLKHTVDEDIQTLTLNDFTYLSNRTKATSMLATTSPVKVNEAYIELKKVAYSRQYSLNVFNTNDKTDVTTATRITVGLVASSNNYCDTNGYMVARGARESMATKCGDNSGLNRDSLAPNTATQIFSVGSGQALSDEGVGGTGASGAIDAYHDYTIAVYNTSNKVTKTYTRNAATITIYHTAHGYAVGDYVDLNFGGSATDGQYKIVSTDTNVYTVTDHYLTSGTEGTETAVNISKGTTTVGDKKDLYFQITNISQSIPQGSGNSIVYYARYTTTHDLLYGGKGWLVGDYFYVWMKDGLYLIKIDEVSTAKVQANLGVIRPQPTPFDTETTTTSEQVLGDIQYSLLTGTKANGDQGPWAGGLTDQIQCSIIGNGLYLRHSIDFNVSALDDELLNVVSDEIQNIDDLPSQCKHGYVVKISNTEANEDDYYLRFEGHNGRDGKGAWEECPEPGRRISFDPATMPIQLVRQGDGNFIVNQITWEDCLVGNNVTVPKPSFISTVAGVDDDDATVNRYINKMVFWRNRLALLSMEDVVLSQPGDFFNFWPKSSIAYTATDVIDISCSSEYPADIYDAIPTNSGLVLFTKNKQFLLTTDSDVLSPQTAKLNTLAAYNFNVASSPISLGTTIGFLDNAGKYTRFWEMAGILREGEPQVIDQTKVVSKLFDKGLNKISNSRENSLIFFSEKNKGILYGFSYFASSEKRLQQAWFKWEFSGAIQHHAVLDDSLYLIIRDDGKDTMQRVPIKIDVSTLTVTDDRDTESDTTDDRLYRVHLDNSKVIEASKLGYSSSSGRTGFTKPDGFNSTTGQLVVYCHSTGDNVGKYALASVVGNPGNYNIEWDGDWTGHDLIVGYLFDMKIEFPTIYPTQSAGERTTADIQGNLILHRAKINFGAAGLYKTTLKRLGKDDYSETWEAPLADSYNANHVGIHFEKEQVVPIYDKNKNVTLEVSSKHPAPATLYSMTWEGDYTTKYYRSV